MAKQQPDESPEAFLAEADEKAPGIVGEFVSYLRHNKKWWLAPILFVLLIVGVLVVLGGSALAPFIYPIF